MSVRVNVYFSIRILANISSSCFLKVLEKLQTAQLRKIIDMTNFKNMYINTRIVILLHIL